MVIALVEGAPANPKHGEGTIDFYAFEFRPSHGSDVGAVDFNAVWISHWAIFAVSS